MHAHIKSFILIILVTFASAGLLLAAAAPPPPPNTTAAAPVPDFPYTSEITEDDVPIRSGPGTNYYICGKLKRGNKVVVVGSKFSWSRIVPPPGSFSWISMRNVSIDPDNPNVGIVTADGIRVYAGSESKEPIHSETLQGTLNRSDEVRFMGKPKGDYYKIAPPASAYLWVSTKYTKPLPAVVEVKKTIVIPIPPTTDANTETKPDPTKTGIKIVVPTKISGESENLKAYHDLEKLIQAERAKPIEQQNFTEIKKVLAVIAGNKDAGKAAKYSDFALRQIKGFELALVVEKEVKLQNEELQKIKKKIDQARDSRLAQVETLGKFAVIGKFQISNIYSTEPVQLYRITDDSEKTVCYALPSGPASKMDLSKFMDSKVGLVGKIEPHMQTSGALVRFTEIVQLK